ncbi:Autophagy-related protein 16-1 [Trichinella patagoniensis]|uniref:Autophagy-related protein 16-1 n=1 Tax=Trichinella patagoniensis TaxID=990121 RepID=A0A0V1AFZ7_9BILA|nr:Autophagy-related protein 16-1 [Trichinella patagoniensis]
MSYRDVIFDQLKCRNQSMNDAYMDIYLSYSELFDAVSHLKSVIKRLSTTDGKGGENEIDKEKIRTLETQLLELQQERADLYKKRGENAEMLIELNRKLEEKEDERLLALKQLECNLEEKQKLEAENRKLKENLENMTKNNQVVRLLKDEHVVLQSTLTVLEGQFQALKVENAQMLDRWKLLNQREADVLNLENDLQMQMRSLKLQYELAEAAEPFVQIDDMENIYYDTVFESHQMIEVYLEKIHRRRQFLILVEAHDGEVLTLCWGRCGKILATGGTDRRLKLWEIVDGQHGRPATLMGCNQAVTCADFDLNGSLVLAGSNDFATRIWSVADQRLRHSLTGHSGKVLCAKFVTGGRVITGSHDRTIRIWDLQGRSCYRTLLSASTCYDLVAVGNSQSMLISGHFDKKIRFWDDRCQHVVKDMQVGGKITSLDIANDDVNLLCTTREDLIYCIDLRQCLVKRSFGADGFKIGYDFVRGKFSPDSHYCICGSADGNVYIWNAMSGKLETVLTSGHSSCVIASMWNLDGTVVATCEKQKFSMTLKYRTETASQLFSRLNPKPALSISLGGLFPDPLQPKHIVEIVGGSGSGKTLLLLEVIASCIIDLQVGVLLLDCDRHFCLSALVNVLSMRNPGAKDEQALLNCLNRLHSIVCRNDEDLWHSLDFADKIVHRTASLMNVIIIDSVSAFSLTSAGNLREKHERLVLKVRRTVEEHNLVAFITRQTVTRHPDRAEETGRHVSAILDHCWRKANTVRVQTHCFNWNQFQASVDNRIVHFRSINGRPCFT